jgi:predicted Zn finger-like uncharacterized protein
MRKLSFFMQGRYGHDQLNLTITVVSLIIYIISSFVFNFHARIIMRIIALILFGIAIFRMLSRNVDARRRENMVFLPAFKAVTGWFSLTYKRFRDGRTHRYYRCPSCKAQLRVKNVKGVHTIRCPKCGNQFQKTIR